MTLMERRRALMAQKAQKEWDFEWDYTQGKLEDQDGWKTSSSGSYGSSLETNGQKLWADSGAFYQIFSQGQIAKMTNGIGVVECVFVGHFATSAGGSGRNNFRIHCVKDSTCRMAIMAHSGSNIKFRVMNNSDPSRTTILANFSNDTEYTVRIELKGATADIYVNGVKVGNGISTSNITNGASNSLFIQSTMNSNYYALLKAFRIKIGRL